MPVRSVVFDIVGRDNASAAFRSASKSAEAAATGVDRSIARMRKAGLGMQVVGQKLTKSLTLPLLAVGAVSVDQAAKFQKSMTLIQTAGGETARKAAAISVGIKKVAVDTGTSLDELSQGIYTVAKAGSAKWSATGQLNVLKAGAQGAKAEGADLGTVLNALTSVMMSYHKSAGQAVSVENQLIRGAGLAKTSMQEYAGSLSTVVPIASAAHIRFSQVAGAIATLTQHGTSADEATQELSNTIRNLQAPNMVATKAMQQLDLNVVNVEKNLGRRGLTGTINLITNAISKKMGPSGLVAVSAFKKSQSASADLNVELAHMPKNLADISRQFETGKMSYSDYRAAVRGLGGQAYQLGMGFMSTITQAKGFNNLLKAGQPAAQTFAAYLKQVMGGATGLNTALQLGGDNLDYFNTATDRVAKAAKSGSGDVLGWAKTQDTLAVKVDKAKANLQVLAVEIGTALIPAVTKIVGWVTQAVTWFDNLSSGWTKTIGIAALVVGALGPVLAIVGRVTRAVSLLWTAGLGASRFVSGIQMAETSLAGMQTRSYAAGLRIRSALTGIGSAADRMGTRVGQAVRGVGVALGALGVGAAGYFGGSLAANAVAGHTGTGVVGGLETLGAGVGGGALTGAAIGSVIPGIGTTIGAGVGAVGGAVAGVVSVFHKMDSAAKSANDAATAALQQQKAAAQQLQGVLESVNAAYDKQYRGTIVKQLSGAGVLNIANKAGVKLPTVVNAAFGKGGPEALAKLNVQLEKAAADGKISFAQLQKVGTALQTISPAAAKAERAFELQAKAMDQGVLNSRQLGVSYGKLKAAFHDTGTTLDRSTAAGERNTVMVRQNLNWVDQSAQAALKHGKSVASVATAYRTQIAALQDNLGKLGLNKQAVATLIGTYGKMPKKVVTYLQKRGVLPGDIEGIIHRYNAIPARKNTNVTAETGQAMTQIQRLKNFIDSIHPIIHVTTDTSGAGGPTGGGRTAVTRAGGGWLRGPGTSTSDSIYMRGSNGEFVVRAAQANRNRSLLQAINAGAPGFANGGEVTHKGGHWYYNGYSYSSQQAADNARRGDLLSKYTGTASSALSAVSTSKYGFSWAAFTAQIAAATEAIKAVISVGASKAEVASLNKRLKREEKAGARAERGVGHTVAHDVGALGHLAGLTSTTRAAMAAQLKTTEKELRAAGVPKSFITNLDHENKHIGALTKVRNFAAQKLAAATQRVAAATQARAADVRAFRQATLSGFDITTAGQNADTGRVTKGSLMAAQRQSLTRVRAWVSGMKKLAGMKIFPAAYLRSLAGEGPDGLPTVKALLSMSGTEMKTFAATQASIARLAGQGAKVDARRLDQGAVDRARKEEKRWREREKTRQHNLDKSMDRLATRLEHKLDNLHLTGKLGLTKGELALIVETGEKENKSRRHKVAS